MKALVEWFAQNVIAANILMVLIFMGGFYGLTQVEREFFPQPKLNVINISMEYPGASPAEVEQQICIRIEDSLDGMDGIDELKCVAREGYSITTVDIEYGFDTTTALNEVKSRIDSIITFPVEAELPQIRESLWSSRIVTLSLYGDVSEAELKEYGLQLKDELSSLPDIQKVDFNYPRDYELAIEISDQQLRRYQLSFSEVSDAIRRSSITLPAGKLRTRDGDIQIQTRSQAYTKQDFENIIIRKGDDGSKLTIGDIATVTDGFIEDEWNTRFNGKSGFTLDVSITQNPNITKTSAATLKYLEDKVLPEGIYLELWNNMNDSFQGRLDTLYSNGFGGLVLVFIVLLLFLRPKVALWVSVGIATAIMGAFWLLPLTPASLNIVSTFAFLLILGILVDDAIIVGESIYGVHEKNITGVDGAIKGATQVIMPVSIAVLTTMVFFGSFLFMPPSAPEAHHIAWVVLIALSFSLVESMFILPAHLANMQAEKPPKYFVSKILRAMREKCSSGMSAFIRHYYRPFLIKCMHAKMITLSVFVMVFLIVTSYWLAGWIRTTGFPIVEADFIMANATLSEGTAFKEVENTADYLETSFYELQRFLNQGEVPHGGIIFRAAHNNMAFVAMKIDNFEQIEFTNQELVDKLNSIVGTLGNIEDFNIRTQIFDRGKPISLDIKANSNEALFYARDKVDNLLLEYQGIYNLRDSLDNPRPEIEFNLKPIAETLQLTTSSIARQVRQAFYGEEAQRIPRKREDVRVMIRYPADERQSVDTIQDVWIKTDEGLDIPLEAVADISYKDSYTKIERVDRKRKITLTSDAQPTTPTNEIMKRLYSELLPDIRKQYPDVDISPTGLQEEESELFSSLRLLFAIAMLVIYGLMAIVFKSYWQPVLIMIAIPYGVVGSVIGHVIFDNEMNMFSIMGLIACAGVVVNDNLVLVNRINQYRAEGVVIYDAIINGACDRFRAIILTSITTFVGLLPIMLETSVQAKFLIPMVLSLSFGVMFATFVTLLLVPCFYYSIHRLGQFFNRNTLQPQVSSLPQ